MRLPESLGSVRRTDGRSESVAKPASRWLAKLCPFDQQGQSLSPNAQYDDQHLAKAGRPVGQGGSCGFHLAGAYPVGAEASFPPSSLDSPAASSACPVSDLTLNGGWKNTPGPRSLVSLETTVSRRQGASVPAPSHLQAPASCYGYATGEIPDPVARLSPPDCSSPWAAVRSTPRYDPSTADLIATRP